MNRKMHFPITAVLTVALATPIHADQVIVIAQANAFAQPTLSPLILEDIAPTCVAGTNSYGAACTEANPYANWKQIGFDGLWDAQMEAILPNGRVLSRPPAREPFLPARLYSATTE